LRWGVACCGSGKAWLAGLRVGKRAKRNKAASPENMSKTHGLHLVVIDENISNENSSTMFAKRKRSARLQKHP